MRIDAYAIERQVQQSHWWFRVRRRIVEQVLGELPLPPRDRARALDLGSGSGTHGAVLARFARVAACDLSAEAFRERLPAHDWCVRADAARLPFEEGAFDFVLAADLLEHLDDDAACLREVLRVLRPGGHALFLVPAFGWLWGPQDEIVQHRRRYTGAQLVERVQAAGYEVARSTYFNTLLLPAIFVARTLMRRLGMKVESENKLTPGWTNQVLEHLFALEVPLLRRTDLPVGVSFLCLARRAPGR